MPRARQSSVSRRGKYIGRQPATAGAELQHRTVVDLAQNFGALACHDVSEDARHFRRRDEVSRLTELGGAGRVVTQPGA